MQVCPSHESQLVTGRDQESVRRAESNEMVHDSIAELQLGIRRPPCPSTLHPRPLHSSAPSFNGTRVGCMTGNLVKLKNIVFDFVA